MSSSSIGDLLADSKKKDQWFGIPKQLDHLRASIKKAILAYEDAKSTLKTTTVQEPDITSEVRKQLGDRRATLEKALLAYEDARDELLSTSIKKIASMSGTQQQLDEHRNTFEQATRAWKHVVDKMESASTRTDIETIELESLEHLDRLATGSAAFKAVVDTLDASVPTM
ncbi:hypothetical protein K458DRAFT_387796 [Lentithecium fluviatile CBS 122367]|uniref:Uncharacterized protein n=1 Tax=Lentithecium fluviatile CBS 122367 TaxID=1168545 RepID=A0A6G1J5M5_9PLEO|nr:hypothetical protein K458DRAFT_387796 [Lentithecium fluviatile CBS 122367]